MCRAGSVALRWLRLRRAVFIRGFSPFELHRSGRWETLGSSLFPVEYYPQINDADNCDEAANVSPSPSGEGRDEGNGGFETRLDHC